MGGEREFKTPAKKSGSKKDREQTIGELRIHESEGEVHFHDDAKKIKVAMPVATWYSAWERIWKEPNTEFNFADAENGTLFFASVVKRPGTEGKPAVELSIYVEEMELSDGLKDMIAFMDE